jgi:hypothetical protein
MLFCVAVGIVVGLAARWSARDGGARPHGRRARRPLGRPRGRVHLLLADQPPGHADPERDAVRRAADRGRGGRAPRRIRRPRAVDPLRRRARRPRAPPASFRTRRPARSALPPRRPPRGGRWCCSGSTTSGATGCGSSPRGSRAAPRRRLPGGEAGCAVRRRGLAGPAHAARLVGG